MTTPLRPRPSHASTIDDRSSQYVTAHSYTDDSAQESMWTAPSPPDSLALETTLPYFTDPKLRPAPHATPSRDPSVEYLARPRLASSPSTSSTASSGSEVDMSGSPSYPFFSPPVPPTAQRPLAKPSTVAAKENVRDRASLLAPSPRPTSPLPPLPDKSSLRHLRGPTNTTTVSEQPYRAPPLTAHNSLATFQAHHLVGGSTVTTSEDSHRTSSDVDLDLSFDYDARQDVGNSTFSDEREGSRSNSDSSCTRECGSTSGEGSLEKLESAVMKGGWVGIEMRPQTHGIPEGQLVRSESGKLVGALAAKARSELDLRAQFKADAEQARAMERNENVSVVVMQDQEFAIEDEARRREIRAGKRPVEGERARWAAATFGKPRSDDELTRNRTSKRRSVGRGFAYNTTESVYDPPRSAPPMSEPVFAAQQDKPPHQVVDLSPFSAELDEAKRTKAFPLPLRLIDRTKRSVNPSTSPKIGSLFGARPSRQSVTYYDSDLASNEPSPLFDRHTDDERDHDDGGTVQTAPSTPNDTPLFQECFQDDETTPPPVPEKPGQLAGLGFDFGGGPGKERDEFPTVPLRRRSLPPPVPATSTISTRRMSNRHMPIPSLSISPPPRHTGGHDLEDILETDSSRSSQDSAIDPTVSPSRRLSRRLSSSNPDVASRTLSNRRSFVGPSSPRGLPTSDSRGSTSTPNNDRGATVITPQHLLETPSDRGGQSPSFSFSPAPLRLVKAQLLRAAGYDVVPTQQQVTPSSPALDPNSILHIPASPRRRGATPQEKGGRTTPPESTLDAVAASDSRLTRGKRVLGSTLEELSDLLSSSAETWIDEVIPAKLAFIAGFLLGPWCWIIGGWFLRPYDGELFQSRGQRCREVTCDCGRILRGSIARQRQQHTTTGKLSRDGSTTTTPPRRPRDEDDFAGLDKWVFVNRVAAVGGGVGIAAIVGVAIWAAASA
ncbi:hypothetical protein JCM10212_004600 [Sporobolomyces blumeae]